jgi:hypothetical protein
MKSRISGITYMSMQKWRKTLNCNSKEKQQQKDLAFEVKTHYLILNTILILKFLRGWLSFELSEKA